MNEDGRTIRIDVQEFFRFLGGVKKYPTNGYRLAELAKEKGTSQELVAFFEGLPGQIEEESEIVSHAMDICTAPRYFVLDLAKQPNN